MNNVLNQFKRFAILRTMLFISLGVLLLANPQLVIKSFVYIVSGYLVVLAILNILKALKEHHSSWVSYDFITGCMYLLLGIIAFVFSKPLISFLPIVLGLLTVLNGLLHLGSGSTVKEVNPRYRISIISYSIILILAGCILIFNPFKSVILLLRIFGGLLIFMGTAELINYIFQVRKF